MATHVGRAGRDGLDYQVAVKGQVSRPLPEPFSKWRVEYDEGNSLLIGRVIDQVQLVSLVDWLGERGIEIISLAATGTAADENETNGG